MHASTKLLLVCTTVIVATLSTALAVVKHGEAQVAVAYWNCQAMQSIGATPVKAKGV